MSQISRGDGARTYLQKGGLVSRLSSWHAKGFVTTGSRKSLFHLAVLQNRGEKLLSRSLRERSSRKCGETIFPLRKEWIEGERFESRVRGDGGKNIILRRERERGHVLTHRIWEMKPEQNGKGKGRDGKTLHLSLSLSSHLDGARSMPVSRGRQEYRRPSVSPRSFPLSSVR